MEVEVAFHDVDLMAVVWHGHYFKYLELARWRLMDRIGYGFAAMRDSGYLWPIIESHMRHVRSAASATGSKSSHRSSNGRAVLRSTTWSRMQRVMRVWRERARFRSPCAAPPANCNSCARRNSCGSRDEARGNSRVSLPVPEILVPNRGGRAVASEFHPGALLSVSVQALAGQLT